VRLLIHTRQDNAMHFSRCPSPSLALKTLTPLNENWKSTSMCVILFSDYDADMSHG